MVTSPHRTLPGGRLRWAWFGVVSTLLGVGAGELVASITNPAASPVLAVSSTFIDATPEWLKQFAIDTFGSNDKLVLISSVVVVVLLLSAIAGVIARRSLRVGAGILTVLVLVAGAAALTRPSSGVLDALPSLATLVAGVGGLLLLGRYAARERRPSEATAASATGPDAGADSVEGPGAKRRTVLLTSGLMVVGAAVMGGAGRLITNLRSINPADVKLPQAKNPLKAFPTGLETKYKAITPLKVSNADFYRVDTRVDNGPIVDLSSWTLTIDGDVDQEVSFTFDDLLGMDVVEEDITLTCVSNSVGGPYVGGTRWLGVRLKDLLDKAGISNTKADQIFSTDVEGMTISTPLELAIDGRPSMIAFGMDGEALPQEHGFPARLIVPGLYGFIGATKWISKMTLTTYDDPDAKAYWTERKWDTDAPIKISSRIDTPKVLSTIKPGKTVVGGVAWAQEKGGVAKVQVQIDGKGWQDAQLGPDVGNDYWRQWYYDWDAPSGTHSLACRVIAGNGDVQTAARAEPFPGGSSGIQSLQIIVGG